jgi:hypothetical protein
MNPPHASINLRRFSSVPSTVASSLRRQQHGRGSFGYLSRKAGCLAGPITERASEAVRGHAFNFMRSISLSNAMLDSGPSGSRQGNT